MTEHRRLRAVRYPDGIDERRRYNQTEARSIRKLLTFAIFNGIMV